MNRIDLSIQNLDRMFSPRSVAIIGASPRAASIGAILTRNLQSFEGTLYLVNPHHSRIGTRETYPSVRDLPEAPDLAVIATPAPTVPGLIAELGGEVARAVAECAERHAGKPVVTSWLGGPSAAEADRLFAEKGIANYATPERAIRAFMHVISWRRAQTVLMETPPSICRCAPCRICRPDDSRSSTTIGRWRSY